jgi:phosphopantothenoylcysteine decarboxylase/phosphopantothenate--cysteine ligase
MGYAIARAARNRGARVILISGPVELPAPQQVELVPVTTAREMHAAVMARVDAVDVIIKAAAVADFRPAQRGDGKLKKGQAQTMTLELLRNPDILAELGGMRNKPLLVGFAAETADLLANARQKLVDKGLDLIVANDVSADDAGFGRDTNRVQLIARDGTVEALPCLPKGDVAARIVERTLALLGEEKGRVRKK